MQIGAVLPLCVRGSYDVDDLGRTEVLFRSLVAFTPPDLFSTFFIVTPPDEVEIVQRKTRKWRERLSIEVLSEETLVPELAKHPHMRGWRKQQIVKLAIARNMPNEFFITFDADVICLKPLTIDDLIVDGKAILQYEQRAQHPKWWKSSSRVLNMSPIVGNPQIGMTVTPAILAKSLCENVMQELGASESWVDRLCKLHNPRSPRNWSINRFLQLKWTEYSLYYLAAHKHGKLDDFHVSCGTKALPQELLIHDSHPFEHWDVAKSFSADRNGLFCVVGSKSRLEPEEVWQTVGPYIPFTEALLKQP